ncbi:MAG: ADP-ribosylglycohydrolase family protein [Verrucomicrobia bacterium]|nr:ADP-ribosylglycohydrolase family protein [Verrucomicrobiota bacterium]MBN8558093.1 ADP-ribosylglycohydrolase family protein [Burkholderiales bacterium]
MPSLNRRSFCQATGSAMLLLGGSAAEATLTAPSLDSRICGLLSGSALGDALGGPIEFQEAEAIQKLPDPPRRWQAGERLNGPARTATAARLRFRDYAPLRVAPESYGQWNTRSTAGTVTDDTRHKLVLLQALRTAETGNRWPLRVPDLARAYLDWHRQPAVARHGEYTVLCADWLEEWNLAARWILGERDPARARPPECLWQGLPTCCGQMTSLPLAALYPGRPEAAYRAAWHLGFFDNGWGRDLNAAIVAGLSEALVVPVDPGHPATAWQRIFNTLRTTDPLGYRRIRWTQRAVDRWLDYALRTADQADRCPAQMFQQWDREFQQNAKWEAQIPWVVMVGCLHVADYDPLAALQLTQEWGWDTDSYSQLLGAFLGALYGPELFPSDWLRKVSAGLLSDFGVALDQECALLVRLATLSRTRPLVAAD